MVDGAEVRTGGSVWWCWSGRVDRGSVLLVWVLTSAPSRLQGPKPAVRRSQQHVAVPAPGPIHSQSLLISLHYCYPPLFTYALQCSSVLYAHFLATEGEMRARERARDLPSHWRVAVLAFSVFSLSPSTSVCHTSHGPKQTRSGQLFALRLAATGLRQPITTI
jgi:hypothetical protein